jgi:hypothetical protein
VFAASIVIVVREEYKPREKVVIFYRENTWISLCGGTGSSETLVTLYKSTRQHVPEDFNLHQRHYENQKSHIEAYV